jgi:hypothetical protein
MGCHLSKPPASDGTDDRDLDAPQDTEPTMGCRLFKPPARDGTDDRELDAGRRDSDPLNLSSTVAPQELCNTLSGPDAPTGSGGSQQRAASPPQQVSPALDRSAEINRAVQAKFKGNLLAAKR